MIIDHARYTPTYIILKYINNMMIFFMKKLILPVTISAKNHCVSADIMIIAYNNVLLADLLYMNVSSFMGIGHTGE